MGHESVCEETVVKKRTLEEKVNEGVEEMPDEDYADLCGRGGVQETYGGEVGGQERARAARRPPTVLPSIASVDWAPMLGASESRLLKLTSL